MRLNLNRDIWSAMNALRTDHMEDHILERTAMPEENVRKAEGETIFEEERPLVCTIFIYYLSDIC